VKKRLCVCVCVFVREREFECVCVGLDNCYTPNLSVIIEITVD